MPRYKCQVYFEDNMFPVTVYVPIRSHVEAEEYAFIEASDMISKIAKGELTTDKVYVSCAPIEGGEE